MMSGTETVTASDGISAGNAVGLALTVVDGDAPNETEGRGVCVEEREGKRVALGVTVVEIVEVGVAEAVLVVDGEAPKDKLLVGVPVAVAVIEAVIDEVTELLIVVVAVTDIDALPELEIVVVGV